MIWLIDQIEIREYQFTECSLTSYAAYSQGVCLTNRLEPNIFNLGPKQILVCEACGTDGCATSGWVNVKRMGNHIAFVPAFNKFSKNDDDHWELESSPPDYFSARGTPFLKRPVFEQIRERLQADIVFESIPPLTAHEAVKLTQWFAPNQILDQHPNRPELNESLLLATSVGDFHEQIDRLKSFINQTHDSQAPLIKIEPSEVSPIEFYLDDPNASAWSPVAFCNNQLTFNFLPAGFLKLS